MIPPFVIHTADGQNLNYPVPFPYIHRSHVKVYINDVEKVSGVDYTWATSGSIRFTSLPVLNAKVRFERITPTDPLVVYQPSAALPLEDLRTDSLQALYRLEEMESAVGRSLKFDFDETGIDSTLPPRDAGKPLVWSFTHNRLENGNTELTGDLLLRGDLASSASGKGGELIKFKHSASGAIERTVHGRLTEGYVSLLDFIPVAEHAAIRAGTSTFNCTSAVQAAVNCGAHGIYAPEGRYRLTAQITCHKNIRLYGDGVTSHTDSIGELNTRGTGTWFWLDHTGDGLVMSDTPTTGENGQCSFENFGTYRTRADPTGTPSGSYTPLACGADIVMSGTDMRCEQLLLLNPSTGIRVDNAGRLYLMGIRGQPLTAGIEIVSATDVCRIKDVHFWPFWSNNVGVRQHMRANATAIMMRDVDNPELNGIFCLGYANGCLCLPNVTTLGMPVKVILSNFDFDNGGYGFRTVAGGATGTTALLSNGYILGVSAGGPGNASNICIESDNSHVLISNVGLDLPQDCNIKVLGTGNVVRVTNVSIGRWNFDGGVSPAVECAAGNVVRLSAAPVIGVPGSTAVFGGAGTISCPLGSGVTSGTTSAGGFLTLTHNIGVTPRVVVGNTLSTTPYVIHPTTTKNATSCDVQVRDFAGNAVASTAVTVEWTMHH